MGGSGKWRKYDQTQEQDGGPRNTFKEDINYSQQYLGLIQTFPNISTIYPPKLHANDPIDDSGFTGYYLDNLTTIVNTREPSENPINTKPPIHPQWYPLTKTKFHLEIYQARKNMQRYIQLCDDELIVTFDKQRFVVRKKGEYY